MIRLTAKQRHFAEQIANGRSYTAAYRAAYHCYTAKPSTIRTEASRLANSPKILAVIEEIERERYRKTPEGAALTAIDVLLEQCLNGSAKERLMAADRLLRLTVPVTPK
jgi:phage terminase small subunit